MRFTGATIAAALATTAAWAGIGLGAAPAGAAVTATSSGSTVTVTTTAGSAVAVTCNGGQVRAQGIAPTPPIACASVTAININGDAGNNVIDVRGVGPGFSVLGNIRVAPAGGTNLVFGSRARDTVTGSNGGQDQVWLEAEGAPDGTIALGGEANDTVTLFGTSGNDRITVASGSPLARTDVTRGTWSVALTGTRTVGVVAGEGDDVIDASGLGDTSVVGLVAQGGPGNDTVRGGTPASIISGGTGSNDLIGGPKADVVVTESVDDEVEGRGGADVIHDQGAGAVGDRTLSAPTTEADEWVLHADGDAVVRARARTATTARVTAAMARTGVQDHNDGVATLTYEPDGADLPADRVLFDIAALPVHAQRIRSSSPGTVVDLVVPTGSWTRSGSTVTFTGPYRPVDVGTSTIVSIRAPYTDPEERFVHRLIRDLEMRIPSASERTTYRTQLESRVTTRDALVARFTSTDAFRGLAVDRAFVDVLRRSTDSAGRAYWVDRLRRGTSLRRMRASLYGSNEYSTAYGGGTVAGYVNAAYRDILGREPDAAGLEYWVGLVAAGTPRGTVADRFLNTPEARSVIVRDQFLRWADRKPTSQELQVWTERMGASTTDGELTLIRSLASSSTYFDRPDI